MSRLALDMTRESLFPPLCHFERSGEISYLVVRRADRTSTVSSERCLDWARHDKRIALSPYVISSGVEKSLTSSFEGLIERAQWTVRDVSTCARHDKRIALSPLCHFERSREISYFVLRMAN